ncbi:MAG: hypothetical protein ABIO91_01520 [Pyrinomonadaceae bacterium]
MKGEKAFCVLTALIVMLSALANSVNAQSKDKLINQSGSVYIQTNGVANQIIHYARQAHTPPE